MVTNEMILDAKTALHSLILKHWLTEEVFSVRWWGLVLSSVISYVLLFYLLDKRRFTEIIVFGALLSLSTVFGDTVGANFAWWTYQVRVLPIVPSPLVYDFTIVPVYFMLVYQYNSTWRNYMIWNIVTSGVISFGYFNILIAFDILATRTPLWVNFLELVVTASLTRACVLGMLAMEKKYMK